MKIKELRERLGDVLEQMQLIADTAEAEQRDLTDEEVKQWDQLNEDAERIRKRIEIAQKQEELRAKVAAVAYADGWGATAEEKEKQQAQRRFSLLRAIEARIEGRQLDGIELEMHQEAVKEARESGITINGIGLPGFFFEKRDLTVGTATAGGNTVATDLGDLIPALRPRLLTERLGATILTGLRGNLDLPRHSTTASASWYAENGTAAESDPAFDKISLSPKRLAATMDVSKQLIAQGSFDIEAFLRAELEAAIREAVDAAAINGSGTSNQPTGILNTSGIGVVSIGTNGGAPTHQHIIDLETEVAVDNADIGALAYLTTPGVRGRLKRTAVDAGSGQFVWQGNEMNGYRAEVSTQVPSNLTKGSGTNLHAILFGNWNDLIIANWAGVDIVVDPYTKATSALVAMTVNSYWDVALRHAESFAAVVDADPTA